MDKGSGKSCVCEKKGILLFALDNESVLSFSHPGQ